MDVKVRLDPKLVWKLSDEAEELDMSLSAYLGALVKGKVLARRPWTAKQSVGEETRRRVRELHSEGFTDAEIAVRVDRVREHVAMLRRGMGLKPNRRRV